MTQFGSPLAVSEDSLNPDSLTDPAFHGHGAPHAVWRWMRQHQPVYWHPPAQFPGFWSITRYEDIRTVYRHPELFSSARGVLLRPTQAGDDPGSGLTLALTDPPRHKQLRSMMTQWFSMQYARSLEDAIRTKVQTLLSQAIECSQCDFAHEMSARLTLYVTCHILGVPEQDQDDVLRWTYEAFNKGQSIAAHRELMLYFCELIAYKRARAHPADDLASAIVHGTANGQGLTEEEILLNFENLIGATENAGLSLSSGIRAFLEFPETWTQLNERRELITSAIEEVLRWASSASHSMRTVTEPVMLHEQRLKAGDRVVLWLPSANRDERIFTDPFQFDITRSPNPHLALGYGEHACIGNALARMQMRVLLNALLDMESQLELEGPFIPLQSIYVNGPQSLPVRWIAK